MISLLRKDLALLSVPNVQSLPKQNMTTVAPLHGGINILLGGAMMSVMLLIVFCICYCCHKRVQKSEYSSESTQQWLQASEDSDSTLQVFTLDSPQCYESAGVFVEIEPPPPSPPPSYEAVMGAEEKKDDPDLPTYETALTFGAHGYV